MTSDQPTPPGAEIRLRPLAPEHLEQTYVWLQDQGLRRDFRLTKEIDRAAHQAWFEKMREDPAQAVFAVEAGGWGHIGNAGVKNLDGEAGELWIYLGPGQARARGLGTLAARELVRILFRDMGLIRIYLHVAETNKAALRVYEKLGFARSKEAPSPEWAGKDDGLIRLELLNPEALARPRRVLLGGFDAGGANSLAVLARELAKDLDGPGFETLALVVGPARSVFKNQGLEPWQEFDQDLSLDQADQVLERARPDCLILGTSLTAMTERYLCRAARERKIPAISLIDFWSNYAGRFSTPGSLDLAFVPDRIAALDEFCRAGCIREGLPAERIILVGSPYWDHLGSWSRAEQKRMGESVRQRLGILTGEISILVISSNLRNLDFSFGFGEEDIFRTVFQVAGAGRAGGRVCCLVKPHPNEPRSELEELVQGRGVVLDRDFPPVEAALASDVVVGSVSSLVFEAALLGRRVVSFQPALFPGQTLGIFSRMGIPEVSSPREMAKLLREMIEDKGQGPEKDALGHPFAPGSAVNRIRALVRELVRPQTGGAHDPRAEKSGSNAEAAPVVR